MAKLLSIQYLRAFAALMVLVYHAMRWANLDFDIGAAGVDVFFVISGFILWTVSAQKPVTPLVFLGHRWVRVAPLYWLMTLIAAAIAWRWPAIIWDAHVNPLHLLLSLAFIQHLNSTGQPFPVITTGWSLNYEAVFYLIFAASLMVPAKRRFLALTLGLVAVPVVGAMYHPAYFLGANMMFLQFIGGIWLAQLRLERRLPGRDTGVILAVLGIFLYALLSPLNLYETLLRPFWWGGPALLLVAGLVSMEGEGGLPKIPLLALLGDASYSIYLSHMLVIQLLGHGRTVDRMTFTPVAIVASIGVGIAVYYWVERPLIALFRRRPAPTLPSPAV